MRVVLTLLPLLLTRALLLPLSRALDHAPWRLGVLPDLSTVNGTIGHGALLWALGLEDTAPSTQQSRPKTPAPPSDDDDAEEAEGVHPIGPAEMRCALDAAMQVLSDTSAAREGWKTIFSSPLMSLMKRRAKGPDARHPGPVEYLMVGCVSDVSARTFLMAQINRQSRGRWDRTMKAMEVPGDPAAAAEELIRGARLSMDSLYYRTKWPWPLKDRDYTLARRCRVFPKERAIVLVSKSIELPAFPPVDGVIRVDRYWCHSTIVGDDTVDAPGCRFVTIFSDDQKVPLPAALVDIISAQGEKVVPGAIERLHKIAQEQQQQQGS